MSPVKLAGFRERVRKQGFGIYVAEFGDGLERSAITVDDVPEAQSEVHAEPVRPPAVARGQA
jgi:hypothetical protein